LLSCAASDYPLLVLLKHNWWRVMQASSEFRPPRVTSWQNPIIIGCLGVETQHASNSARVFLHLWACVWSYYHTTIAYLYDLVPTWHSVIQICYSSWIKSANKDNNAGKDSGSLTRCFNIVEPAYWATSWTRSRGVISLLITLTVLTWSCRCGARLLWRLLWILEETISGILCLEMS